MDEPSISDSALSRRLARVGVGRHDGEKAGYVRTGEALDLDRVANALPDAERDGTDLPAVACRLSATEATVAVFENGTVAVVDAADTVAVMDAVSETLAALDGSGLFESDRASTEDTVVSTEIPYPPAEADAPGEATACDACGAALSGEENYCPECGTATVSPCSECGTTLSGEENYCPQCGVPVVG